jgi:two-component sensor histidine kinase
MKKIPSESKEFEEGVKSALELIASMHETVRDSEELTIYEFVKYINYLARSVCQTGFA